MDIKLFLPLLLVVLLTPSVLSQRGAAAANEGYEYPTPSKPFTLPPKTTKKPEGYEYPTPEQKLTFPPKSTTPRTTTPEGYEYPVPNNPLQLPRRGRRRPLESHKITPGKKYKTCTEMAKDNEILPRPGVNCLHVPLGSSPRPQQPSNKTSDRLPLLRNIPADIFDIISKDSSKNKKGQSQ